VSPILRRGLAAVDHLATGGAVLAGLCLVLLAVVLLAELASLAALGRSLVFSWEYAAFLMAGSFFLAAGWTLRCGGHVRVQLMAHRLSAPAERALDAAATLLGLAIAIYLTAALTGLAYGSWAGGSRTFTPTATPLWIPQGVTALGSLVLVLQLIARLVRLALGLEPELPAGDHMAGEV
jgi:TRAP-type C4-dicarboxylate transport system permease small subunit